MPRVVIQHMEETVSEWCGLEYQRIFELTKGDVLFTNVHLTDFTWPHTHLPCHEADLGKRVCLLDMKAEKPLSSEDQFDTILFGGILGNVIKHDDGTFSSDDKTKELRKYTQFERRHLGPMQMSTDTAVHASLLTLANKDFKYIDCPEISMGQGEFTVMDGFRYILGENGEVVIPKGMKELMMKSMDDDLLDDLL
eukprot:Lithocolla_globosa_v1_NODE_4863_length_1350_cov_7.450193.p1 type:complete len:195 gc:universal NODE_4863_length_1350_cov_7.450193:1088-504(-)